MILILLAVITYLKFKTDTVRYDFSAFEKDIEKFEEQMQQDSLINEENKSKYFIKQSSFVENKTKVEISLFDFNPNNLTDSLWLKLGIKSWTIKTIKNYLAKGGKFYKKEDLKKIYGFDLNDYNRLEPYIVIPVVISENKRDSAVKETIKTYNKSSQPIISFDLNSVSTDELKSIYGIGDIKAKSIVQLRKRLGGFFMKEQLMEAYGIDSSLFDSIKVYVDIKTKNLLTININTANELQLKHPYISRQLAVVLVNYRKMHGAYNSVEEIKKLPLVNDELYRKLAPYLTVD